MPLQVEFKPYSTLTTWSRCCCFCCKDPALKDERNPVYQSDYYYMAEDGSTNVVEMVDHNPVYGRPEGEGRFQEVRVIDANSDYAT